MTAGKIAKATEAIDQVHQDQTMSLQETLDALKEVGEHVDFLIGAVKEDIRRETRNAR